MPMKLQKFETDEQLKIERIMYTRRYSLTLDKRRCVVCELCETVCPREAIHVVKPEDGEQAPPKLEIDVELCQYCGICNAICPFGALELKINGEKTIPVVKFESFPQLIRDIKIDAEKCPVGCTVCMDTCPLKLITVKVVDEEGRPVENVDLYPEKERLKVTVEIEKEYCPVCRLCEYKCPYDAIHTQKIIYGHISVKNELCPEGCRECVEACPIPEALQISEDGRVVASDLFCVYCGACRIVCPVEGAISLERTVIRHTPVHSGAWNKALEKLTSTKGMAKELRSRALIKVKESVERRLA